MRNNFPQFSSSYLGNGSVQQKNDGVYGKAAQVLLNRGRCKATVEVDAEGKQHYISALTAVNERLKQN